MLKAKRLLELSKTFETNENIDLTISSAKPPIFWKEKEITKQQLQKWKSNNIRQLIYALSEIELQIKKNINSTSQCYKTNRDTKINYWSCKNFSWIRECLFCCK